MADKVLMLGNEAIARGAYEAGVKVSSAYPGTPSTEISEFLVQYKNDVYEEWAPNEKVAAEVAVGASIAGVRAMACMKHVGLNVAADPLYSVSYMGVNGGLVLVVADDPGLYSSQNEQDTRMVARAAQIPVIEPSDSAEATVTPVMEKLKEAYLEKNPDVSIEIQQSDSSTGMSDTIDGTCDIGMASRELKDSETEKGLTATVIAMDGITVIVNNDSPVDALTSEQVKNIFTGDAVYWSDVLE